MLCVRFSYKTLAPKNFKPKTQLCIFWRQNFVQKTRMQNVDEIDSLFLVLNNADSLKTVSFEFYIVLFKNEN